MEDQVEGLEPENKKVKTTTKVTWFNLHVWGCCKDVRKIIYKMIGNDKYTRFIAKMVHNSKKEWKCMTTRNWDDLIKKKWYNVLVMPRIGYYDKEPTALIGSLFLSDVKDDIIETMFVRSKYKGNGIDIVDFVKGNYQKERCCQFLHQRNLIKITQKDGYVPTDYYILSYHKNTFNHVVWLDEHGYKINKNTLITSFNGYSRYRPQNDEQNLGDMSWLLNIKDSN